MKGEELMEAMGGLDEALLKKADSYKAEKRSGFGWTRYLGIAACIMLLVGLAVINMSLANVNSALAEGDRTGQPLPDGDAYKVVTIQFYYSETEDRVLAKAPFDFNTEKGENRSLYVMAVTGGEKFEAIVAKIKEIEADHLETHRDDLDEFPDPYEALDLSYAIPVLRFSGYEEEWMTEYYFMEKTEEGTFIAAVMDIDSQTGQFVAFGGLGMGPESDNQRYLRLISSLTTEDKPVIFAGLGNKPSVEKKVYVSGFSIIGDTAYIGINLDRDTHPIFQNYTPEINWQRVKDYGWELEVKKIDLY